MRPTFLDLALACLLLTASCASSQKGSPENDPVSIRRATPDLPSRTEELHRVGSVAVGMPAPWFAGFDARRPMQAVNMQTLKETSRVGRIALVFFMTTCPPCANGLTMIQEQRSKLFQSGVLPVLIAVNEEPEQVMDFLDRRRLEWCPVVLDRFGVNAEAYGLVHTEGDGTKLSIPKTFVIGAEGRILGIFGAEGRDYIDRIVSTQQDVSMQEKQ